MPDHTSLTVFVSYILSLLVTALSNPFYTNETGNSHIESSYRRLATHLLTAILFVAALIGAFVHYGHFIARKEVKLHAPPGSIAVTAAITARSPLLNMLDSGMDEKRIEQIVKSQTFRVDDTGKIILADEPG
jgi:hypothetical protein